MLMGYMGGWLGSVKLLLTLGASGVPGTQCPVGHESLRLSQALGSCTRTSRSVPDWLRDCNFSGDEAKDSCAQDTARD